MAVLREGMRPAGARRLWLATRSSLRDLRNRYRSEAAFRQEAWFAMFALPAAIRFGQTGIGFAKDLGSSAVLLALVTAVLTWCFVLVRPAGP